MISNSIIKLIDEAILPAAVLILGKLLGFFLVGFLANIEISIEYRGLLSILPALQFESTNSYIIAENFSNITMFTAAAIGCMIVLVRAHFFHESHIHPNMHARLASLNLESIIAPSYHLYHQAVIWIVFLWLTTGFLLISTIFIGVTNPIVTIIAFIVSANFSWILSQDIEQEVEISRENQ